MKSEKNTYQRTKFEGDPVFASQSRSREIYIGRLNRAVSIVERLVSIGKGNNRPILIKFNSFITKQQIFDRSAILKGSNYKLDNDYDYNTRQIRKKLLPFTHEARGKGYRANIINDKLKINGKIYDLDHLENGFRNAENLDQIHNRRHSFRARSNSPIRNYNESPNRLFRRRRFSSSERGKQEEEIEQLNY
ncbi:hypothetical protein C0J52_27479 [Blattella germanica]|nr:hypothetical protein C0J52_27479 [Blattella germanica]